MRLKFKIDEIKYFDSISDYAIQKDNIFSIKNPESYLRIENALSVQSVGNRILVLDDLNKPYFIEEGWVDESMCDHFRVRSVKYPYIGFYKKTSPRTYGIYDANSSRTLFETEELIGRDIFKNYILGEYQGEIISRDIISGRILWQFNLSTIPNNPHDDNYEQDAEWEIKKIIGVLENKLWIALNHHTIIALDITMGALLHQIHDIKNFRCDWLPSAIPLTEATVIDEKENKLIGFMWEFYWEINPTTGKIEFLDLTDELLPQKIRNDLPQFVMTEKYIYFASHFDSKVGGLNRVTKKTDWEHAFEKDESGLEPRIMDIQGNDETLGVLSSKGVLYLFENV